MLEEIKSLREVINKKITEINTDTQIGIIPFVSEEVISLTADKEEQYSIAQANAILNERNEFTEDKVDVIKGGKYLKESPDKIDLMDVSPKQVFSVTTSLIPFLEHDDANRALMGSNMQRQAVPLIHPEAPLISTGMEGEVAKYSGQVINKEPDKCLGWEWFEKDNLPEPIFVGHRKVLKLFLSGNKNLFIQE